jgi:hypothetical protein
LTPLERLEQLATNDGIEIFNYHISDTKKSACFYTEEMRAILLDKPLIVSKAEETVLLAEEIGHYKTGSLYPIKNTYNTSSARLNRFKCEAKAKRWAIKKVLPVSLIQNALKDRAYNDYEMAEYCDVPINFLREALQFYTTKGFKLPVEE